MIFVYHCIYILYCIIFLVPLWAYMTMTAVSAERQKRATVSYASTGKQQKMQPLPKKSWTWIRPRTHKINGMDTQLVLINTILFFGVNFGILEIGEFAFLGVSKVTIWMLAYMRSLFSPSFLRIGLANWQGCCKKGAVDWGCCMPVACLPN